VLPSEVIHQVLERAPDAIVVVDVSGRIVFANGSAYSVFGYEPGSLDALEIESLVPARARGQHMAHRERYSREARDRPMGADQNLVALRRDGAEIPVEISLSRIAHDTGPLVVAVIRDASARRRAATELSRLNRLYAALSQANQAIVHARTEYELLERLCAVAVEQGGFALAWIGLVDGDGVFRPIAADGPARDYLDDAMAPAVDTVAAGRERALRSAAPVIINDYASLERVDPGNERARAFGLASSAAFPLWRDKRVIGVLAVYSTAVYQFGEREISLLTAMATDISLGLENLRRDLALRRTQEQLKEIASTARAGAFSVVLPDWSFWWSAGAAAILGLPDSCAPSRESFDVALGPGTSAIMAAAIDEAARAGTSIDIDMPIVGGAGGGRYVHLYGRARVVAGGRVEVGGTLHDITDRKRLEAELAKAAESERRRLSFELHENLGQLLFGASLLLSAAVREASTGNPGLLGKLTRTTDVLDDAMRACRTIAHGSTPVISGQLAAALSDLAAQASAAGVDCVTTIGDIGDAPLSALWATGLYRIAQEAVANALQHGDCSRIDIVLRSARDTVMLEIIDNGRGFGREHLDSDERLGIPTMRYRAARAGGTIEVHSQPNCGATVRVLIPRADGRGAH
jgi:PAS domain S-box-containing protein